MKLRRQILLNFSLIGVLASFDVLLGAQAHEIGPLSSALRVPTQESPERALLSSTESQDTITSPPVFLPSHESPSVSRSTYPQGQATSSEQQETASSQCSLDLVAALSEDQILKKVLGVYAARHGLEKLRELIFKTTGLMLRVESLPESLNSVLAPDSSMPSSTNDMALTSGSSESYERKQQSDQGHPATEASAPFGEKFSGTIGVDVNIGSSRSIHNLENSLLQSSDEVPKAASPDAHPVVVFDRLSSNHPIASSERFLIIPGRRQRPFGTKVRVMVRNKVREVKIITSPRMSVYDALKQAEKKIQFQYPELASQKVIQTERRLIETKDGIKECSTISRVGRVEEDEANGWFIRVTYSPGVQVMYEGRCVPNDREVYVRPATTIDLIYNPRSLASSSSELSS